MFGVGGGVMTVAILFLLLRLAGRQRQTEASPATPQHSLICGFFFFAMATYNLCPLLGVRCIALHYITQRKHASK
jgi:hypothetical protein